MYHEPLVHPVINVAENKKKILILGGGDGCAVREILKYNEVKKITLVDLDPKMTD
jgi:spermidine synthase